MVFVLFCLLRMITWIVLVIGNGKNLTVSREFSGKIDSTCNTVFRLFFAEVFRSGFLGTDDRIILKAYVRYEIAFQIYNFSIFPTNNIFSAYYCIPLPVKNIFFLF